MTEITDSKLVANTMMILDAANTEGHLFNNACQTNVPNIQLDKAAPTDQFIGQLFDGKYRIEKRLGEGGMGIVYRATHVFIERPVAIKFLRSDYQKNAEVVERFKLEARAAGRIQHVNVTSILDFGSNDIFYLVMEYLQGQTLRQQLHSCKKLSPADMLTVVMQVCAALDAAHKCNIIHRDLKPENIFLQQKEGNDQVKVLDFGIAKILQSPTEELTSEMILGTPYYMSPEQCQCDPLGPATDIYSMGVIIFEMLTGRLPFIGTSPISIAFKHLNEKPPKLRHYCPELPEELEDIVARALAKRPEQRQSSAQQLALELQQALGAINEITLIGPDAKDDSQELAKCSNPDCCSQSLLSGIYRCSSCQALAVGVKIRHRFKVNKLVGKGGFGTTYLVSDEDCFAEPRILKELCPHTGNVSEEQVPDIQDTAERLFKREAMVLLNMQHQGIPKLYAYFNENHYTYLVQDFIPGQTLSEELKGRNHCYNETEALAVLNELGDVLEYLHSCTPQIIHRDIKPQNIMRHKDGQLMLIDFGAVCQAVANPEANQTVIGSLGYAPPEQFLGQTMPQSDLYAVGATVVYLLTGIPPRLLLNSNQSLRQELSGKVSEQLISILTDLLVTDVEKRLPSASQLKRRLEMMQPSPTITTQPSVANHVLVKPTTPARVEVVKVNPAPTSIKPVMPVEVRQQSVASPRQSAIQTPTTRYEQPRTELPVTLNMQDIANFCYEVELTLRSIEYANHFGVLGIKREATEAEIRQAFLQLTEKFDPARHQEIISYNQSLRADLEKIQQRISEAFRVLCNKNSRNEYTRNFRTGRYEIAGNWKQEAGGKK